MRVNHKEVVAYTSDLQARIKSNENKIASLEAALMETKAELQNVKQEYELSVLENEKAHPPALEEIYRTLQPEAVEGIILS